MAWRTPKHYFIAPGATVQIRFWWGTGVDHGAQWAMAHPLHGEPETWLVTERVGKKLICEIGVVQINGDAQYKCGGTGSSYEYAAWLRNDGSSGCRCALEGGRV